mmetsp:Transcript_82442/g.233829  ORF Transcript_82442/g.233829 Transcript_82442/m.233829 type:complete len:202 (-) Transcript_82442:157-762(-)
MEHAVQLRVVGVGKPLLLELRAERRHHLRLAAQRAVDPGVDGQRRVLQPALAGAQRPEAVLEEHAPPDLRLPGGRLQVILRVREDSAVPVAGALGVLRRGAAGRGRVLDAPPGPPAELGRGLGDPQRVPQQPAADVAEAVHAGVPHRPAGPLAVPPAGPPRHGAREPRHGGLQPPPQRVVSRQLHVHQECQSLYPQVREFP